MSIQAARRMSQAADGERNGRSTGSDAPLFAQPAFWAPLQPIAAPAIQAKLAINDSEEYEREADRIAMRVTRMPGRRLARSCACGGTCADCQENSVGNGEILQTKRVGASDAGQGHAPPSLDAVLRSSGEALDPATRANMELSFGRDFSGVRVHAGASAQQSAQDLNAQAYTVGHDIVFGAGRFAPGTEDGQCLLAHELTHVAQQADGMPAVQRAPADKAQSSGEETAARLRGRAMAERLRHHGKLSKEARAKINQELAHFTGSAKDAYLKEVRPALLAVTEIEMPAHQVVPRGPSPIELVSRADDPHNCGGAPCMSDDAINAAAIDAAEKGKKELKEARAREAARLTEMMRDWLPDDQAFALELLARVMRYSTNVDARAVSDSDRQPILAHYEQWMRKKDQQRTDECKNNPPGWVSRVHSRFSGDLPCVSWFSDQETPGYTHASHELQSLGSVLQIFRGASPSAVDQVFWDVFEYRRLTDPKLLEMLGQADAMVGAVTLVAGAAGEKFGPHGGAPSQAAAEEARPVSQRPALGPDTKSILGGGQTTAARTDHLGSVDLDGTVRARSPVTPTPTGTPEPNPTTTPNRFANPTAANDNIAEQAEAARQQQAAGGGGSGPTMVRRVVPPPPLTQKVGSVKPARDVPSVSPDTAPRRELTAIPKSPPTVPEGYEDMPDLSIKTRVSLEEDHHIATRYRKENAAIFKRAGLSIDHDLNLIKDFPEHGQLRGWYKWEDRSYKFEMNGHHPDYNAWVTKTLNKAVPRGLSPDQALGRIEIVTGKLDAIIRNHPEVLSHGPKILPLALQNVTAD